MEACSLLSCLSPAAEQGELICPSCYHFILSSNGLLWTWNFWGGGIWFVIMPDISFFDWGPSLFTCSYFPRLNVVESYNDSICIDVCPKNKAALNAFTRFFSSKNRNDPVTTPSFLISSSHPLVSLVHCSFLVSPRIIHNIQINIALPFFKL